MTVMKKTRWVFLGILILGLEVGAKAQDSLAAGAALTLKECVDIAIKNNLMVRQRDLNMQGAKVNFDQARANTLPTLNAGAGYSSNFGRNLNQNTYTYTDQQNNYASYSISASLNLFSGLQVLNGIKQNALLLDASRMDWQQQKDAITLQVILAYLQVLSSQDLLLIARSQAEVDAKQVARLELMRAQGAVQYLSTY